jgi:integrase
MAGLRSAEILRLKWENVNWPESVIEIHGKVAKTGTRRLAPLVPAAAEWLRDYKNARGPVIGAIKLYERLEKLSESTGVAWKQNALRHSFCSYRMATLKDAPRVSYEAGNSVRIIQRHYDKVVTESQGTAWFSIMPKTAKNVVQMVAGK